MVEHAQDDLAGVIRDRPGSSSVDNEAVKRLERLARPELLLEERHQRQATRREARSLAF